MVAWNEYREMARERGALALELFVVESTPQKEPDALKQVLPDHLAYQAQMEADGYLVLAGPLSDPSGNEMQGTGLIIYRAENLKTAKKIAEADPMHATGTRSFTIRKWLVNEGSLNISVGLSTKTVRLS